jgi:hypothetical protein
MAGSQMNKKKTSSGNGRSLIPEEGWSSPATQNKISRQIPVTMHAVGTRPIVHADHKLMSRLTTSRCPPQRLRSELAKCPHRRCDTLQRAPLSQVWRLVKTTLGRTSRNCHPVSTQALGVSIALI